MSNITLNFFGDSITVPKPKNLQSLRKIISLKFYLKPKDAEEIILTYTKEGQIHTITTEEELQEFYKSKVNKIDFDISEKSQIFEENLNKLQEETITNQKKLQELIGKNRELENLKKTKFISEIEEMKNINSKIVELTGIKNQIKKKINDGTKLIDKEIKENLKKIKALEKKLKFTVPMQQGKALVQKQVIQYNKKIFANKHKLIQKVQAQTIKPIHDLNIVNEGSSLTIDWQSSTNAESFDVYRADSIFGEYTKVGTVNDTSFTTQINPKNKYANYFKVAVAGSNQLSDPISIEIDLFGDNVHIFAPTDDREQIYNKINEIYKIQAAVDGQGQPTPGQQFGSGRHTFAFKTGDYSTMNADNYDISYYMQVIGLGKLPTDVKIKNIHVPAVLPDNNVTCNFWMAVENFEIPPETVYHSDDVWFQFLWSVSQAAPARRLNLRRSTMLDWYYGWASGGYIADSKFEGAIGSYPQQQYYIRNCNLSKNFYGVNWNLVAQGVQGISTDSTYNLESGLGVSNWKSGKAYTILNMTDVIREKPFLFFDESDQEYKVFAPALRTKTSGTSWSSSYMGDGTTYKIDQFYVAKADKDNASTINAALNQGKHILLTPGIYYAEEPIKVNNPNTIVLGLGLATIIPAESNKEAGIIVADVDGVTIAGIILDAQYSSKNMIVVGNKGSTVDHSANPIILQDLFVRIGGVHPGVASTEQAVVVNSNNVIGDDFWLWRADHGDGVGWDLNKAKNGLVVNGNNVTMYGLMCEHFQEYDIIWRGEYGKTYFLQNEKCYDPQNQNDWKSHEGTELGFSAYKVCNNVKNHYAVGLGSYDVFINTGGASIFLDNPYEVPDAPDVLIENACTVEIANASGPYVGFNHICNGIGPGINTGTGGKGFARQMLISYRNTKALTVDDYYKHGSSESGIINEEKGQQTSYDPKAEEDSAKLTIHSGIKCKGCGLKSITGCRYKCSMCDNFDYCEKCESKLAEQHGHPFLKIYDVNMTPSFFKCTK